MITKADLMSMLVTLEDQGLDINIYMKKLITAKEPPIDVLRFIHTNRGFEVANFYELLRKNYNLKKSPIYINLVKEELKDDKVLSTLSSLLTQIILYSNKLDTTKESFLKAVRAKEIASVIQNYFVSYDLTLCRKLLRAIKSDIVVMEWIAKRRDIAF